jgi:hypothetical protein
MIGYTWNNLGLDRDIHVSQVISLCQDIAGTLDEGVGIDGIIIDFFMFFYLVSHGRLLTELATSGRGFKGSCLGKGLYCRSYRKGNSRRVTVRGNESNLRCAIRERFVPAAVCSLCI